MITIERARYQAKLNNPIFAFAMDLAYGKVKGFETYKADHPIVFDHDITAKDFPVTEPLFQTFKTFAVDKYKYTPAEIDKERDFVERSLRTELVTAAYGSQTSLQVSNEYNNQLLKAIGLFPKAKELAMQGSPGKSKRNPFVYKQIVAKDRICLSTEGSRELRCSRLPYFSLFRMLKNRLRCRALQQLVQNLNYLGVPPVGKRLRSFTVSLRQDNKLRSLPLLGGLLTQRLRARQRS